MIYEEESHKVEALIGTLLFHGLLLLVLYVFNLKVPDPPSGGGAVGQSLELNYGEIQEQTVAQNQIEEVPEVVEEEKTETDVITAETDDVINEVIEAPKEKPKEVQKVVEKKEVVKIVEKKEVSKVIDKGKVAESDKKGGNTDDPNKKSPYFGGGGKVGKGNGSGDNKGSGSSLNLSGWEWDVQPKVNDDSKENGRIVFQVKVNSDGEILGITTIESTVSSAVEKKYRKSVENLSFTKTDNSTVAPVAVGTLTFIIRSR